MITTLGYPRSGNTFVQYMLTQAVPAALSNKLHGHDVIRKSTTGFHGGGTCLLTVIRDYKECIMSQLTRGDQQNDPPAVENAFIEYMTVLQVYDNSTCLKGYIYYENMIMNPAEAVADLGEFFKLEVQHIIDDIDTYVEKSMKNYVRNLGPTLTTGKEVVHFGPLTKEYHFDWDQLMYDLNPELYDKYLARYGANNE